MRCSVDWHVSSKVRRQSSLAAAARSNQMGVIWVASTTWSYRIRTYHWRRKVIMGVLGVAPGFLFTVMMVVVPCLGGVCSMAESVH